MTSSYFQSIRGTSKRLNLKSSGQSDLFDSFHGIGDDEFRDSPLGYARAYTASSMMFRCVNVIASTVASLDFVFYDRSNDPIPPEHKAYQVFGKRLWRTTSKDMFVFGKAYWLLEPEGVFRINPLYVNPDKQGNQLRGFFWNNGNGNHYIQPENMAYFFDYDPEDDLDGVSPAQVALRNLGVEVSIEEFVKNYFLNDATPAGILTSDQNIMEPEAERLKRWWERWFKGVQRAFRVAVLGKNLTYQQITPLMKDLTTNVINEDTARKICQAFGVPLTIALATDAANYSTAEESRKSFYTETVLPFVDVILTEANEQVVPYIDENIYIDVDRSKIEILQEDRVEITTRSTSSFQAGVRGLNEARILEGEPEIEIAGGDLFLIGGIPTTLEEIQTGKLPHRQQQQGGGAFMALGNQSFPTPPIELRDILQARKDLKKNDKSYIIFGLACEPILFRMQNQLYNLYPDIELQDPYDFHMTSLAVYSSEAIELTDVVAWGNLDTFPIQIEGFGYFQTPNGYVIFADVRRDGAVWERHQYYRAAMEKRGYQVTEWMSPAVYHPHITLGVLPYKPPTLPTLAHKPRICPSMVYTSEEGENGYQKPASWQLAYPDVLRELTQWQTKAIKRHAQVKFETTAVPSATAAFIRMELDNGGDIKEVFKRYKDVFASKQLDLDPADFPTPEEFEAYWKGIGDSYDEMNTAIETALNELPLLIAENMRNGVEVMDEAVIFQGLEERLMEQLAGDEGALIKVYLAGAARGNDLLKPSLKAITTSWELILQEALRFARKQAAERVKGITEVTKEIFRIKIADWVSKGGSLYKLADWIEGRLPDLEIPEGWSEGKIRWATSPARALTIAQTEATTLFNRGVEQRWKQAGVQQVRYRTQNDGRVCNLCYALNNRVGDIEKGVEYQGRYYKPPSHIGCRCHQAPISRVDDLIQLTAVPADLQMLSTDPSVKPPTVI